MAVVIREDAPDEAYRIEDDTIPQMADLPGEGHGVLIAPRWVVTVTHATRNGEIESVLINGIERRVERLVSFPGYRTLPPELAVGDAFPVVRFFRELDDLTLIELSAAVTDIAPMPLFVGTPASGTVARIVGRGASGDGRSGEARDAPHRGQLRQAENRIVSADGRWITYRFDCDNSALPLEGVGGGGDSGGPLLIDVGGQPQLAGLIDWKSWTGDLSGFRKGVCNQTFYNVRLQHYAEWMSEVMGEKVRILKHK